MARTEAMAAIDAALQKEPLAAESSGNDADDGGAAAPHPAPGVDARDLSPLASDKKPTLTAGEERAWKVARTEQQDAARAQQQEQDAELQRQQQEQDAFSRLAETTTRAFSRVWQGTQIRLASLPAPGGLTLPFVTLLVLFFLLVPVNGHTRFTWLWLTLTNNAEIEAGGSNSNSDTTTSTAPDLASSTAALNQSIAQVSTPLAVPSTLTGTYVEGA